MSWLRLFIVRRAIGLTKKILADEPRRVITRNLLLLFGDYANEIRDEKLSDFCYAELYKLAIKQHNTLEGLDPYALTTTGGSNGNG